MKRLIIISILLTGCASNETVNYAPTLDRLAKQDTSNMVEVCTGRTVHDRKCAFMDRARVDRIMRQMFGTF